MVFAIYIAVGVEGAAAYNTTCTGPEPKIVQVQITYVTLKHSNVHVIPIYSEKWYSMCYKNCFKKSCTAGQPTDQCVDTNAECNATSLTCGCKSTHIVNKDGACNPKGTLNTICGVAETAQYQCEANTECQDDGNGTKTCLCKTSHYESSGACTLRKSPQATCASNECVVHSTCDSGTRTCVCDAGYNPSPTISPTMCSGDVKVLTLPYIYVVPVVVSMMLLIR
ncbi:unnamed protein product [Mytilus edulis]|uniref:EGF-like domain-containing protein n=1 Tax=Mytilus edulis TaxID=6550 RepID=A0A8S3QLA1_MYTED|nr:unnamed protein product [Mytilus edulis]